MIIQAYKSRITGEVFEDLDKYRSHHRTALIHKKYDLLRTVRKQKFADAIVHFRETVCTIDDIEQWVIKNSTRLAMHLDMEKADRNGKLIHYQIIEFNLSVRQSKEVSNSHSAPLNGGIINWGGNKPGVPRFYPGWKGNFKFRYIGDIDEFPSKIVDRIGIFSGSGSGGIATAGEHVYNGQVSLFDADWPALKTYKALTNGI